MTENRVLVIASGNQGKIHEFQGLLSGLPLEVKPQPEGLDVEETGATFAANARIKALAVAQTTGHWALADDSGLSVSALNGAPGVHSARYAPTDPERIEKLLAALLHCLSAGPTSVQHFVLPLLMARSCSRWKGVAKAKSPRAPAATKALDTTQFSRSTTLGAPLQEMPLSEKKSLWSPRPGLLAAWNRC
jgi:XTP/dITP diphosphohydrolase